MHKHDSTVIGTEMDARVPPRENTPAISFEVDAIAILEAVPDAVLVARADGIILYANYPAEKLFGSSRFELIGRSIETLLPEVMRTVPIAGPMWRARAAFPAHQETGGALVGHKRNGARFSADVRLSELMSADGLLLLATIRETSAESRVVGQPRDQATAMSDHMKIARASATERLLDLVGDGVIIYNRDMRILHMSPTASRLLGIDEVGEAVDRTPPMRKRQATIAPPGDADSPLQSLRPILMRVLRAGATVTENHTLDVRLRGLEDGYIRTVSVAATPLRPPDRDRGEAHTPAEGALVLLRDVTDQRKHEQDAMLRAAQLGATIEAMADGVVLVDADERLLHLNAAARRLLQLEAADADTFGVLPLEARAAGLELRDEDDEPLPPGRWPTRRVVQGETLASGTSMDVRVRGLDGAWSDVNVEGAPMRDAAGNIYGGVLVFREVTTRREQERRTRRMLEDLIAMARLLVDDPLRGETAMSAMSAMSAISASAIPADPDDSLHGSLFAGPLRIADRLARLARNLLRCQSLTIVELAAESDLLLPMAAAGLTPEREQVWRALAAGSTLTAQYGETLVARLRAGEVLVADVTQPPYRDRPDLHGAGLVLVAPLRIGNALVGAMTIDYGQEPRPFAMDDLTLVGTVAELAVRVLERERLLLESLARADAESHLQMLQAILDELPCAVCLVRGPGARLVLANRAIESLFGANPSIAPWALAVPLTDFLTNNGILVADAHGKPLPIEQVRAFIGAGTGQAVRGQEAQLRLPGGSVMPILVNAIPVRSTLLTAMDSAGNDDEPLALVVMEDVSVLKAAERLKDEFIAVAAHELRNPMGTVKGYAQLMEWYSRQKPEHRLSSWQTETLRRIVEAMDLLAGLTDDLLDVTRLQGAQVTLNAQPHDLTGLVRQVANRLQVTTTRHTIKLHARTQRVQVQVDARRIEQVLANLIGNAIKYSPDGGGIDIAVALDRPAGMARVTVTDHGIGVPREAQDQIFERFVRANNARERGIEGTGLGLFVCRAFVELHGGRIWLTSDEGQGTSFFVTLPLASRTTRRKRA